MTSTAHLVNGMTVDELLAYHRAHFGDLRMEADDAGGDQGGDGQDGGDSQDDADSDQQDDQDASTGGDTTDWKAMARKHERDAKANRAAAAELAALKAKDQTETERLAAERDAEKARTAKATQRAIRAEVKSAAAALKFKDPGDALRMLDLEDLTDDDGEVDEDAVSEALKKIADAKPYLLDGPAVPPRSGGERPGGGDTSGEKSVDDYVAEFNKK